MAAIYHVMGAISDGSYAQTIRFAQKCFGQLVFNLEQEIDPDYPNPPAITANITTSEQFLKIRLMTEKYIADNRDMFDALANTLKDIALKRMATNPESAFGIPPVIQEFPLPEIPDLDEYINKTPAYALGFASGKLARGVINFGSTTLRKFFYFATSPPVMGAVTRFKQEIKDGLESWDEKLLPSSHKRAATNISPPNSETRTPE